MRAAVLCALLAAMLVGLAVPAVTLTAAALNVAVLSALLLVLVRRVDVQVRMEEFMRQADWQKEEFLSMLGHQLRGPLATLRAGITLLEKTDDKDILETVREALNQRVRELSGLINDLLDVSRLNRNRLVLQKEDVDLRVIVQRAVDGMRKNIEDRQHGISLQLPAEIVHVFADPLRVERVLEHLLDNATKFTAKGGAIRVTLETKNERAVISVRDSGHGIAEEKLQNLFQLYSRTDFKSPRTSGLGIGLPLAKKLIELHGGQLFVAKSGPEGTEVKIVLGVADTSMSITGPQAVNG